MVSHSLHSLSPPRLMSVAPTHHPQYQWFPGPMPWEWAQVSLHLSNSDKGGGASTGIPFQGPFPWELQTESRSVTNMVDTVRTRFWSGWSPEKASEKAVVPSSFLEVVGSFSHMQGRKTTQWWEHCWNSHLGSHLAKREKVACCHSFSKYLLSAQFVLVAILGPGDRSWTKRQKSLLTVACFLVSFCPW